MAICIADHLCTIFLFGKLQEQGIWIMDDLNIGLIKVCYSDAFLSVFQIPTAFGSLLYQTWNILDDSIENFIICITDYVNIKSEKGDLNSRAEIPQHLNYCTHLSAKDPTKWGTLKINTVGARIPNARKRNQFENRSFQSLVFEWFSIRMDHSKPEPSKWPL